MNISMALSLATEMLDQSPTPALDARLLLEHMLGVNRSYLIAHASDRLPNDPLDAYLRLVARAEQREPIPYITGSIGFRYLEVAVTPAVLIPRPETELLIDHALRWLKTQPARESAFVAADVGCGSGCIAVSLATEAAGVEVHAVDVSAEALTVAQRNAVQHNAAVTFHHGSLLAPIDAQLDILIANLPYVTEDEYAELDVSVQAWEPELALVGGADGLDLVRDLLEQAVGKMRPSSLILLEIGWKQGAAAVAVAQHAFPNAKIDCLKDYAENDRIIRIELR